MDLRTKGHRNITPESEASTALRAIEGFDELCVNILKECSTWMKPRPFDLRRRRLPTVLK